MSALSQGVEVFLQPGEWHFGDRSTRVRTLLGSCVSITLWHPRLLIGGMCHYMLPTRTAGSAPALDGRYAEEALCLLLREIDRQDTRPQDYEVKLFGGGNMFPSAGQCCKGHVGKKNAEFGKALLRRHGLRVRAMDLGGIGHRCVLFDIDNGNVWVKRVGQTEPDDALCMRCEAEPFCRRSGIAVAG